MRSTDPQPRARSGAKACTRASISARECYFFNRAMVMVGRDVPGDHMHASQARECLQERTVQFGAVGDSSLGFH